MGVTEPCRRGREATPRSVEAVLSPLLGDCHLHIRFAMGVAKPPIHDINLLTDFHNYVAVVIHVCILKNYLIVLIQ